MKTYELQPSEYDGHKSFYHKAKVQELESGLKFWFLTQQTLLTSKMGRFTKCHLHGLAQRGVISNHSLTVTQPITPTSGNTIGI